MRMTWLRAAQSCAMTLLLGTVALAGAPLLKTQAPGYYRMMLGDFEVTALSDGTFPMNAARLLTHITPEALEQDLRRSFLTDPIEESVNGFLINTGTHLVLIDTGAGSVFAPSTGKLLQSLEASGYRPEQVDEIYITHMHPDHIGGLVANGARVFPNATVRAARQEADYWLSQSRMAAAPAAARQRFAQAMQAIDPYRAAGKFETFSGDVELVPGIRAIAAPGHTPGHTLYRAQSKDQVMLFWGDVVHVAAAQFPDPSVTIHFDSDSAQAAAERQKVFAEVAEHRDWIAGAHLSFPGIGHLRANGPGYTFVHANYTSLSLP